MTLQLTLPEMGNVLKDTGEKTIYAVPGIFSKIHENETNWIGVAPAAPIKSPSDTCAGGIEHDDGSHLSIVLSL